MTKTAAEVKGITTDDERPAVIPMKTDMENKQLSKKQFVEKYALEAEAENAAKEAKQKVLDAARGKKSTGKKVDSAAEPEPESTDNDEKIEALRAQLAEVEAKLKKDPDSKKLLKDKNKISADLDAAEDQAS